MKKLLLTMLFTLTANANTKMTCEAFEEDRCFPKNYSLTVDLSTMKFKYSMVHSMKEPFCGWPPAGFYYSGTAQYQNLSDHLVFELKEYDDSSRIEHGYFSGELKFSFENIIYNCIKKKS